MHGENLKLTHKTVANWGLLSTTINCCRESLYQELGEFRSLYDPVISLCKEGKGKAVPLQTWSGPEGYRNLRFPDFMTMA